MTWINVYIWVVFGYRAEVEAGTHRMGNTANIVKVAVGVLLASTLFVVTVYIYRIS